jgi:GT2 family glycosyltransferase/glycosyltransferase involved in cell wall biosynthesis
MPHPERSGGELRFVSMLKIMADQYDIDFCILPSHVRFNIAPDTEHYVRMLKDMGITVHPLEDQTFSRLIREQVYDAGFFNLHWVGAECIPDFRKFQPGAYVIVDSIDVHFAREETQAKRGEIPYEQVNETKRKELATYRSADAVIAASRDDKEILEREGGMKHIFIVPIIVPTRPRNDYPRKPIVIFIGSYTWYPNPAAVKWFIQDIWPSVRSRVPEAEFHVIGSDPTPDILALSEVQGVTVVGFVQDTRSVFENAALSVAPMLVGGGMKGKVSESFSYGVPVVSTSIGAQGFAATHGREMMIADDAASFADSVAALLQDPGLQYRIGIAGQQLNHDLSSPEAVARVIAEMAATGKAYHPARRKLMHDLGIRVGIPMRERAYLLKKSLRKRSGQLGSVAKPFINMVRRIRRNDPEKKFLSLGKTVSRGTKGLLERINPKEQKRIFLEAPSADPQVSIIIPVYNKWSYTHRCLNSVGKFTKGIDCEVILADDHSTDTTRDAGKIVQNLRVSRNETNLGFLRNCNRAASMARGRYLVFLNNDTEVRSGWLHWMLHTLEQDPNVGIVGSKLIFPNGRMQEAGSIIFNDGSAMNYGRDDDPDKPAYNYLKEVDYCTGASICIRKELWQRAGGFDDRYAPAYYEDPDLSMTVRKLGYKCIYQPLSVVTHFEGISHGTDLNQGIKKKQAENMSVFHAKWQAELEAGHHDPQDSLFRARERSRGRKVVLYIFPMTSGHEMMEHLEGRRVQGAVVKMTFKTPDPGDTFARDLQQKGIELIPGPADRLAFEGWLKENASECDEVYIAEKHILERYADMFRPGTTFLMNGMSNTTELQS